MRKIIVAMHVSLDGFVAGPNREMRWIKIDEELTDYIAGRIGRCESALYGRVTYQMMEDYWPNAGKEPDASRHDIEHSQWYNQVHKIVLSKTLNPSDLTNTTVISGNLAEEINPIKNRPGSEILLFGSPTATHSLLQQDLIDGYWLFVNPILLGQGIRLFEGVPAQTNLELVSTRRFASGVTELNYMVNR